MQKPFLTILLLLGLILTSCTARPAVVQSTPAVEATPLEAGLSSIALCNLDELTWTNSWQLTENGLEGKLIASNYTAETCILQGIPEVTILDSTGKQYPANLTAIPQAVSNVQVDLVPDGFVELQFAWTNWCGEAPSGSIQLQVSLANFQGHPLIPLEDPNARPLQEAPTCKNDSQPSLLAISSFLAGQ